MLDWLGWLADLLLNAGADVASLSVSKDAPDFVLFHSAVGSENSIHRIRPRIRTYC